MRNRLVLICLALATASCAVESQLLSGKSAASGPQKAVVAESGVRVVVDPGSWQGRPSSLPEVLTPVRVTVENSSGRPLRLAYRDLSLDGKKHYPALAVLSRDPPVALRQNASPLVFAASEAVTPPAPSMERQAPIAARFPSRGFFVAPFYKAQYPRYEPWPRPFKGEPESIERQYLGAELPSPDMLSEGVPEGVLEHQGFVTGFVYFQRVDPKETRLNFNLRLSDPDTEEHFGTVTIPLAVRW